MATKRKCCDCKKQFYPCYLKDKKIPCENNDTFSVYRYIELCAKCLKKRKQVSKYGAITKKKVESK